eukprot:CAMPEP_0183440398 /NCGR_PEP_ID=MMETSP0370-20130417/81342_1 /TAXON_ID=268820 /ORGANISM="Peridinium aciculiferum, Strain PAER-2" /LENGTH=162 /DNA_ID=CAMNT_0025629231 /DNA_START=351 /DNA_END=835 /DNA_ORIENTATION=+
MSCSPLTLNMPEPRVTTAWAVARLRVPLPSAVVNHSSPRCQNFGGKSGRKYFWMAPWIAGSASAETSAASLSNWWGSSSSESASRDLSSVSAASKKFSNRNGFSLGEKGGDRTICSCTSRVVQMPASFAKYSASSTDNCMRFFFSGKVTTGGLGSRGLTTAA